MRKLSLVVVLMVAMSGCAVAPNEKYSGYAPPAGTRLILKQDLTIPPGQAGVVLQYGGVVSESHRNFYHPSCRLEVNDVRDTPQTVKPDEFVARRVERDAPSASISRPVLVADGAGVSGGGPAFFVFRTLFYLESARQPQVRALVCQQWSDPGLGQHLTIEEIRAALGSIMELQLPDTAGGK
jgi:hypothetical protein